MTKYQLSEETIKGLDLLANATESESEEIKRILLEASSDDQPNDLAVNLTKFQENDAQIIFLSIFNIISLNLRSGDNLETSIKDVLLSYKVERQEVVTKKIDSLYSLLLSSIADAKNVKRLIKATLLIQENEKVFRACRIVSDIRLVFDNEIQGLQNNAVILHNLKIEYFQNGESKEYFVALDSADLIQVRDTLNRAIEKDSLIRQNQFSEMNFINLNK